MRRLASLLAPIGLGFSLGLSLLLAAPVAAQDRSGTVEISPFGGAAFGGSIYTNAVLGTYDRKLDVGNTGTFGLRVGYVFAVVFLAFTYRSRSSKSSWVRSSCATWRPRFSNARS